MSTQKSVQIKHDRKRPATSEVTADDMFESLTGSDEKLIARRFEVNVTGLSQTDPMQFLRCLVFIDQLRRGLKPSEAYEAAQERSIGETVDYFADDAEMTPQEPTTDQGKDDSATESVQMT